MQEMMGTGSVLTMGDGVSRGRGRGSGSATASLCLPWEPGTEDAEARGPGAQSAPDAVCADAQLVSESARTRSPTDDPGAVCWPPGRGPRTIRPPP